MSSVTLTSNVQSQTSNPVSPENELPSAEKVRHIIEGSSHHLSLQQGLPLNQRNITFNRENGFSKEDLSQAPLFIKNFAKKDEIFNYLASISDPLSHSGNYKYFLSMDIDKLNLDPNEIVDLSIVAFFNGDIDLNRLIEINTKSNLIAETFIKKFAPELHFKAKTIVTHDDFLEDSLFKDAEEKNVVFIRLFFLINSPNFSDEYKAFLSSLDKGDWHKVYSEKPEELALFSILAFYDNIINRDELFTLNMASSALKEILSPDSPIKEVNFRVVEDDEIAAYLEDAGFPPFAPNTVEHFISYHNRKQGAELEKATTEFLSEYSKRRRIEKTFIEYTLKDFHINNRSSIPIEVGIYYSTKSRVGYKNVVEGEQGTVVLAPPELIISLYYAASSVVFDPIPQHHFMFGFNEDPGPLYEGIRPISIASALFKLPLVHNYLAGPDLGVTTHDLNLHMPLEVINRYIKLYVDLASEFKAHAEQKYLNENDKNTLCKEIYDLIIDREVHKYRNENQEPEDTFFYGNAFWSFMTFRVLKYMSVKSTDEFLSELLEEDLYPVIKRVLSKHNITCISLEAFKENVISIKKKRELERERS